MSMSCLGTQKAVPREPGLEPKPSPNFPEFPPWNSKSTDLTLRIRSQEQKGCPLLLNSDIH